LAVLPLESLSNDASQDYFTDEMTDELISDLGQINALRVISRTSVMVYKHARKPLPQIARELNVRITAIDRRLFRQALMVPKLRGRVAGYLGAPEPGGQSDHRSDSNQRESTRTSRPEKRQGR
jgi:hypothetical protein